MTSPRRALARLDASRRPNFSAANRDLVLLVDRSDTRKRLKRLAAIAALSVAVALTSAASGASDTRWQLLSYQNARGERAIARTDAVPYPRGAAVRFHGYGHVTFECGATRWSTRVFYDTGFSVLQFVSQEPCIVEAVALAPDERRASVAIYKAMR